MRRLFRRGSKGTEDATASDSRASHVTPPAVDAHQQLWDRAYDELKRDANSSELMQAYEKILSREFSGGGTAPDDANVSSTAPDNTIAQNNRSERHVQMIQVVNAGLVKTASGDEAKVKYGEGLKIILSFKEMIDMGLQAVPQAAWGWVAVCVGLEVRYYVRVFHADP